MNITALIIAVTVTFSPFAAVIAYIVTLDEYQRHLEKRAAKRQAMQSAIFTFIVFIVVGLISGFYFANSASH